MLTDLLINIGGFTAGVLLYAILFRPKVPDRLRLYLFIALWLTVSLTATVIALSS